MARFDLHAHGWWVSFMLEKLQLVLVDMVQMSGTGSKKGGQLIFIRPTTFPGVSAAQVA